MWDTQRIQSSESNGILYDGLKLEPLTRYEMKLQVWNVKNEEAATDSWFETGFLNPSVSAWHGARFIGAPEFYLSSDRISTFSLECTFQLQEESTGFGVIFGANDKRLQNPKMNEEGLCGENYISYVFRPDEHQPRLEIYRVGYAEGDKSDCPMAVLPLKDFYTGKDVITCENQYSLHTLRIEVAGNGAYTYVDNILIDAEYHQGYAGKELSPRTLNPLGSADTITFPRMNSVGCFVGRGSKARIDHFTIRNFREPRKIIKSMQFSEDGLLEAKDKDLFLVQNPSQHSMPMFRREFLVDEAFTEARLYITARGIYECQINGKAVTSTYFNPGLSQYDKHLMYQTYDVTQLLQKGGNAIGVTRGSGWWNDGSTYLVSNYNYWGDQPSFLALLVLELENGEKSYLISDTENWEYFGERSTIYSGFFQGETYDASRRWIEEEFSKEALIKSMF